MKMEKANFKWWDKEKEFNLSEAIMKGEGQCPACNECLCPQDVKEFIRLLINWDDEERKRLEEAGYNYEDAIPSANELIQYMKKLAGDELI